MRAWLTVCLLLLSAPLAAEDNPLKWSSHRPIADWVSTGLVGVNVAGDTIGAWRADDRRHAFLGLACRDAIAIGVSEVVKRLVHRTRPDGSDRMSMPSEHTALAVATGGWSVGFGYTIAIGAGELRGAANKHHVSDIGVGFGVGLVARKVCP